MYKQKSCVSWICDKCLPRCCLLVSRKVGFGIGVGVFATLFNSPFDVVKSRVQAQLPGDIK